MLALNLLGGGALDQYRGGDTDIRVWNVTKGIWRANLKGHTGPVNSVFFGLDKDWIYSGSADRTIREWDITTGNIRFFEHPKGVNSICLSASGQWVLSGCIDHTVRLWEVKTGRCIRTFIGHNDEVNSVAISTDGHFALSGSQDKTMRLWKLSFQTLSPHEQERLFPFQLSGLLSYEEVAQAQKEIKKLLVNSKQDLSQAHYLEALGKVREARQLPGGEYLPESLTAWQELTLFCQRTTLRGTRLIRTFENHSGAVRSVCLSNDGSRVLSGSHDGSVRLWDANTGECLWDSHVGGFLPSLNKAVHVNLSANTQWALSGHGSTLRLHDAYTGKCVHTIRKHKSAINSVCFSPDGLWALTGSGSYSLGAILGLLFGSSRFGLAKDNTLRLWEVSTGRCIRTFKGHTDWVTSVCFSPDGCLALSGSMDCTLRLWDVASGLCLGVFEGHKHSVNAVCFSSDMRYALSGSEDKTLRLWELDTGYQRHIFKDHTGAVNSVCLSTDGRFALSGSHDNTIRVWEVSTGRCLQVLKEHTVWVASVYLSVDGRFAVSGSGDKKLHLWELDWELEAFDQADWNEGAKPYLENFLTLHTPYVSTLPDRGLYEEEIQEALTRRGEPVWNEQDFQELIQQLQYAGYGWLDHAGVRAKLEYMAHEWDGPVPWLFRRTGNEGD